MMSLGLVEFFMVSYHVLKNEWSKERDVSGWKNGLELRENQNQSFDGCFITLLNEMLGKSLGKNAT